jgi:monoamine oxidase
VSGFPVEIDVAIVGAGAAGIAAARRLREAGGLSLLVLEARGRVGGRLWTVERRGLPLDLGGEWLHSADRNPLTGIAEEAGFRLYRRLPDWTTRLTRSGESAEDEADWLFRRDAHYRALERAAAEGTDAAAAKVLIPGDPWNPLLDATSSWAHGAELDRISIHDIVRYEDSGVNWRLCDGFGRMMEVLARGLPVALGAAVQTVEHDGKKLRLSARQGSVTAERAILTVPTTILAEEALRFDPPLPEKVAAAAGLPLGLDNKLFFHLEGALPGITSDAHLVGSAWRRETAAYQIRPFGRPLVSCFFGGRFAALLEEEGPAAMADFAAEELARVFGSDIRRRLEPLAASLWQSDPFARGSYSYALPGHAGDRAILAAPVEGRLFLAGEACSPNFFSAAHGAYESGIAAAEAVLRSLGRAVA